MSHTPGKQETEVTNITNTITHNDRYLPPTTRSLKQKREREKSDALFVYLILYIYIILIMELMLHTFEASEARVLSFGPVWMS